MKHFLSNRLSNILFFAVLFSVFASSCNQGKKVNENKTKLSAADPVHENSSEQIDTTLLRLASFKGDYPSDVKLLDQPVLKDRLKTLLGGQYANFRKYWQTETPIIIEDHILSTTGCEQHNCAANQFVLQIDLMHNNINVYHLENGIQSYLEKGSITLPDSLAKEFKILTQNTNSQS